MSHKKPEMSPAEALKQATDALLRQSNERAATARARRAQLSPQARAAEDAQTVAKAIAVQADKYRAMGAAVSAAESWTITDFAWLLYGGNPREAGWGFFGRDDALPEPTRIRTVLDSCVGIGLDPLDRAGPRESWRYRTAQLLATAERKSLGQHVALRSALPETSKERKGPQTSPVQDRSSPVPAGVAAPLMTAATGPGTGAGTGAAADADTVNQRSRALAKAGTASREKTATQRRRAVMQVARHFVENARGAERSSRIQLAVKADEFNAVLRRDHPEFGAIADKTLEADRHKCKPQIELTKGRPRST